MALGSFFASSSGLDAQSHALGQVSTNIANVRTVGYRTNETMFYTLLGAQPVVKSGENYSSRVDVNGVGCYDRTNILNTGEITATGNNYDIAISGVSNAFFEVKNSFNDVFYTRAGDFSTQTENGVTYLVNSSGFRVQGFPSLEGKDEYGVAAEDIVIKYPETVPPIPTTKMTVTANVPATGADTSTYTMTVYSKNHDGRNIYMVFNKVEGLANTWDISFDIQDGTVTSAQKRVMFDTNGDLKTPKVIDLSINWDNGDAGNISLDLSNMTQLAGDTGITYVEQNGAAGGLFKDSFIDNNGVVKASYSNGDIYNFAKLALTGFTSPENLIPINGTLFEANAETGETTYVNTDGVFEAQSLEQSTVNIEKEFSNMIIIQRAYSLNTQSFTTNNEMLELLIDLKS
ncbi:MAG: flagellar hook-basal body complex protein [Alphaproteobacteria bacterium]|nr:flagellar hook-basal body complex protein [Alphaproteobacteria bacterium]